MFLSYELKKCLGYDDKTNLYSWEYKIIDSEFEEIWEGVVGDLGAGAGASIAIIDVYEKRSLNVAANIVRAFIWQNKQYGWPMSEIVKWDKQLNRKFAKYEEQLNKYLILL